MVPMFQSAPPHGGRHERVPKVTETFSVSIRAPARGATPSNADSSSMPRRYSFNPRPRTGGDARSKPRTSTGGDSTFNASCLRVSIRAPARGATKPLTRAPVDATGVSIRAPARGATRSVRCRTGPEEVSIRAPARGATAPSSSPTDAGRVSIRAPARGATWRIGFLKRSAKLREFQSAPPHGGRQSVRPADPRVEVRVSIRAPARGATRPSTGKDNLAHSRCRRVSIRAPARGATAWRVEVDVRSAMCFNPRPRTGGDSLQAARSSGTRSSCFNPRPRTGGDSSMGQRVDRALTIVLRLRRFNPRPRTGGDSTVQRPLRFNPRPRTGGAPGSDDRWKSFNPRPRTGGDPDGSESSCLNPYCFNPRPRTGGDGCSTKATLPFGISSVSIRAPARGATLPRRTVSVSDTGTSVSIRAPARGATADPAWTRSHERHVSIRAPARGATTGVRMAISAEGRGVSIRAPARGATVRRFTWIVQPCPPSCFNPRPRTGGDVGHDSRDTVAAMHHVSIRAPARGATHGAT